MSAKLIYLCLLFACFTGCQSKQAFEYSEKIVSIERSLKPSIDSTITDLFRFMEEQEFDSLTIICQQMESLTDSKLKEVQLLPAPDVKKADHFKKAAVHYFAHIKNLYTGYKKYAGETNKDKKELERQRMLDTEKKTAGVVEEMKKAQKEFASANGFRIE